MSKGKGLHFDEGKAPLHLIPEEAIIGMAMAFGYGYKKYDEPYGTRWNFKKGIEVTKLTDSLRRHALAYLKGEDLDPESGLSHVWHILANAAMLEYNRIHHPELDDRYRPESFKEQREEEDKNTEQDYPTYLSDALPGLRVKMQEPLATFNPMFFSETKWSKIKNRKE